VRFGVARVFQELLCLRTVRSRLFTPTDQGYASIMKDLILIYSPYYIEACNMFAVVTSNKLTVVIRYVHI